MISIDALVADKERQKLAEQRRKVKQMLTAILAVPLIFAEAALLMWLLDLLNGWSDRILTIGYTRAVILISLVAVWQSVRRAFEKLRD